MSIGNTSDLICASERVGSDGFCTPKPKRKRKNFKVLLNLNGATGGLSKNCVLLSDCAIKKRNSILLSPK